jgi:hypothetical protein
MRVEIAILLLFTATSANAMGDPSAFFWVVGCAVALGVSSVAVALGKVPMRVKLLALLPIGIGAAAVWGLGSIPDYSKYEVWIDAATALSVVASMYASYIVMKFARH